MHQKVLSAGARRLTRVGKTSAIMPSRGTSVKESNDLQRFPEPESYLVGRYAFGLRK
jgi:hypothetical protein